MRRCLYCVGIPGSGKSTLLAAALKGHLAVAAAKPFAHTVYPNSHGTIQLGATRAAFSGTDALPMNVQPLATAWLLSEAFPYTTVIAEGDRLGNDRFFTTLSAHDWYVSIVYLNTPDAVADKRCAERGSNQNEIWIAGRRTKVRNLATTWVQPEWILDGCKTVDELAVQLRSHPFLSGW
jgi:hypothetical protein